MIAVGKPAPDFEGASIMPEKGVLLTAYVLYTVAGESLEPSGQLGSQSLSNYKDRYLVLFFYRTLYAILLFAPVRLSACSAGLDIRVSKRDHFLLR
jgi:hypothetical protein